MATQESASLTRYGVLATVRTPEVAALLYGGVPAACIATADIIEDSPPLDADALGAVDPAAVAGALRSEAARLVELAGGNRPLTAADLAASLEHLGESGVDGLTDVVDGLVEVGGSAISAERLLAALTPITDMARAMLALLWQLNGAAEHPDPGPKWATRLEHLLSSLLLEMASTLMFADPLERPGRPRAELSPGVLSWFILCRLRDAPGYDAAAWGYQLAASWELLVTYVQPDEWDTVIELATTVPVDPAELVLITRQLG